MKKKDKKGLYLAIAGIFAIVVIIRVSYAYLPTDDLANEPQDAQASTATLKLKYTDCASDVQSDCADITADLRPGESITKTFEVKNVGTKSVKYDIYFRELDSSFKNGDLVYTLEDMTTGESLIVRTEVPEGTNTNVLIKSQITSPVGSAARYRLTIKFLDRDYEQSDNYDATFNMKLKIVEAQNGPAENTLAHLKITPNASSPNFDELATTDEGVFAMEDNYGTSYYYRGAVTNNYVKFAGYYWRIIRVNGDGSLRVFYAGKTPHENGQNGYDENTALEEYAIAESSWNEEFDDAKYVGYMFGGAQGEASTSKEKAQSNDTPSTIKGVLDIWYETNIQNAGYAEYVSDTLFCNDRSTVSTPGSYGTLYSDTGLGYGANVTMFGYWNRFDMGDSFNFLNVQPTLKCVNKNDAFTVSDTTKGNGKLSYPIGLVTADEVSLTGGVPRQKNTYSYLYNPGYYWTFSPVYFKDGGAVVLMVIKGELTDHYSVNNERGVVIPVINLSTEFVANMVGEGTMSNPYMLVEG